MIEGRHIKVIARGGDPTKLGNEDNVRSAIHAIVEACGMRVLGLHSYDVAIEIGKLAAEPFEDEGGVTAIGVLSTSHAALHTWPARELFVLDVYSCRDFEPTKVLVPVIAAFARSVPNDLHDLSITSRGCGSGQVAFRRAGIELRMSDLSAALEMPPEWRELAPEFRPR